MSKEIPQAVKAFGLVGFVALLSTSVETSQAVDGIEIAVQLAQKNLLDKELPKIKQKAVNEAHRSIAKKGANSVESPGTTVTERETENLTSLLGENHEEKVSWMRKLNVDPKKVVDRLKKQKGGRYL